jgi:DNA-binding response OmpR family regulator
MSGETILVVDDEDDVRSLVRRLLEGAGFQVAEAVTGRRALRELYDRSPQLVILDVSMPELDGFETLERIREIADVPVLMLTARGTEKDKVRGLRGGADDYLTKPFGRDELLARVEVLLRRRAAPVAVDRWADAYLTVDFARREVAVGDRPVSLTAREFRVLEALVRHANQVLSRVQLLELAWEDADAAGSDQVKLYIASLRRKLEEASGEEAPIDTVRGFGYRYTRRRDG